MSILLPYGAMGQTSGVQSCTFRERGSLRRIGWLLILRLTPRGLDCPRQEMAHSSRISSSVVSQIVLTRSGALLGPGALAKQWLPILVASADAALDCCDHRTAISTLLTGAIFSH